MHSLLIAAIAPLGIGAVSLPPVPQKKLTIERIYASPPISGSTPTINHPTDRTDATAARAKV